MDINDAARIQEELELIPQGRLGPLAELIHYYRVGLQSEQGKPDSSRFAPFCGVLNADDATAMREAIEDCEW